MEDFQRWIKSEQQKCWNCSSPLMDGRKDKKFCDHKCRSRYNNQERNKALRDIEQDITKMKRSYLLLDKVFKRKEGSSEVRVTYNRMLEEGFTFDIPLKVITLESPKYGKFQARILGKYVLFLIENNQTLCIDQKTNYYDS